MGSRVAWKRHEPLKAPGKWEETIRRARMTLPRDQETPEEGVWVKRV